MDDLKIADFKEIVMWLMRKRQRFEITGHSMQPVLCPKDQVLIKKDSVKEGNIIVFHHPFDKTKKMVKMVDKIRDDGRLVVKGVNRTDSLDSKSYGFIQPNLVVGTVTSILK